MHCYTALHVKQARFWHLIRRTHRSTERMSMNEESISFCALLPSRTLAEYLSGLLKACGSCETIEQV